MSHGNSGLAPSGASQNALRPSWDIPGSTFKTLELLQGLIKASSQDDVHPQAILAAEALGAGVLVAPERIKDALEALGANKSFRLEQTRISVGLMYGNTQRAIQSSTPLLQFFILSSAFRLIYIDEEIGDIIFEMMSESGLLSKYPVSPSQLSRLTGQVSGHSELCVPLNLMHLIATIVARYDPNDEVYTRLDQKELAQILTNVFESMRDENVDSLRLTGSKNATWIATAFLWWLQDDASLVIGQDLVHGKASAKLIINVSPSSQFMPEPWKLETWKKSDDPTTYLFSTDPDHYESSVPNRIPLNCMRTYFDACYWSDMSREDPYDLRDLAQKITAELASAIILTIIKTGTFISNPHGLKAKLSTIANVSWLAKSTTLIEEYGWESSPDSAKLQSELSDYLEGRLPHGTEASPNLGLKPTSDEIKTRLDEFCRQHSKQQMGPRFRHPSIISTPVYSIVVDAILTCTTQTESLVRYGKPFIPEDMDQSWNCIYSLLSDGLRIEDFRKLAFRQLLGMSFPSSTSHLMQASSGLVATMNIPWSQTCDPREACAIKLMKGAIRYDGIDFANVRQDTHNIPNNFGEMHVSQPLKFNHLDRQGRKFVVTEPSPFKENSYRVDVYVSVSGSSLHIRQYLLRSSSTTGKPVKCPVTWINAIDAVTLATHLRHAPHTNSDATNDFHTAAATSLQGRKIVWLSPVSQIELEASDVVIIDSNGDETVKLFTAARYTFWAGRKSKIFVHHEGDLLQSLCKACEEERSILII